jgi:hypothetical protein
MKRIRLPSVSVPVGTVAPIPGVSASVPLPLTITSGTFSLSAPTVILGPVTVSPSPVVIPPIRLLGLP